MITPDTAVDHKNLESEVCCWLKEQGFFVGSLAYHDVFKANDAGKQLMQRLQYLNDNTALLMRTRADRIVVHPSKPICFHLECKTGTARAKQDFMPELIQIVSHLSDWKYLGVSTIYVYRNTHDSFESCFLVNDSMPKPTAVLFGYNKQRAWPEIEKAIESWYKPWWPEIQFAMPCNFPNSGDPCLRIPESNLTQVSYKRFFELFIDSSPRLRLGAESSKSLVNQRTVPTLS